jgi:DNA-binding FadR family transcriptional regulator
MIRFLPAKASTRRPLLHTEVAHKIGSQIVHGQLRPGAILPNEASLGGAFGVSRTSLREAIKVLAAKGLIEVRRKTGTRVRPPREWNVLDPDVLFWQFSGSGVPIGITDLMEIRWLIEPAAARLAARRGTAEDFAEIRKAYSAMLLPVEEANSRIDSDLRFHLAILQASHNIFMRPFGALVQAALRASFRFTGADKAAYRRTLGLHRAVLESLTKRKPEFAENAMRRLLAQTSKDIGHAVQRARKSSADLNPRESKRKRVNQHA